MNIKLIASIPFLFFFLAACENNSETISMAPSPPEVEVAEPLKHAITEWEEFTGRFEAISQVDVRSRVTGYLLEKKFEDGQYVEAGDVLYVVDPRPFNYQLERVQAQHALAQREYDRAYGLRESRAISEEDLDRRFQELQESKALLNDARLELSFTEVKAPIAGKISDSFIDVGNLVREDETLLTRIVSVDPIHFRFEGSQGQLLKYLRLDRAGKRPSSDTAPNPIFIKLLDEKNYLHRGQMDFVDNVVDVGTGTIQGRAIVENSNSLIYPGLFGRARLLGNPKYEAILLPEKTINTDQNRKFVYVVSDDNTVDRAYVTLGPVLDNNLVVIREGLQGDEKVIIRGIQRIRNSGQSVTPVEQRLSWTEIETMPAVDFDEVRPEADGEQAEASSSATTQTP